MRNSKNCKIVETKKGRGDHGTVRDAVAWVVGAGECGRRDTPSPTDQDKDFELYFECSE